MFEKLFRIGQGNHGSGAALLRVPGILLLGFGNLLSADKRDAVFTGAKYFWADAVALSAGNTAILVDKRVHKITSRLVWTAFGIFKHGNTINPVKIFRIPLYEAFRPGRSGSGSRLPFHLLWFSPAGCRPDRLIPHHRYPLSGYGECPYRN